MAVPVQTAQLGRRAANPVCAQLEKFGQIHLAIQTNIFSNSDKYRKCICDAERPIQLLKYSNVLQMCTWQFVVYKFAPPHLATVLHKVKSEKGPKKIIEASCHFLFCYFPSQAISEVIVWFTKVQSVILLAGYWVSCGCKSDTAPELALKCS